VLEIASSKPMKVSPAIGCHAKATLDSAKICRETSKECTHRDKGFSESSWLPKMRDPKGTTKDPEEPIPKVGQKVHCFLETHFTSTLLLFLNSIWFQVIIVDPNRSGYFNFRALAVVSRERFSGSGSRKFKEVEVHCTEANVLKEDTFWLPTRSLEMEIWSPVREANMRLQNKIYEEHIKSFEGLPCSCSNSKILKLQVKSCLSILLSVYIQNHLRRFYCILTKVFQKLSVKRGLLLLRHLLLKIEVANP
jgi:hypothetical protein